MINRWLLTDGFGSGAALPTTLGVDRRRWNAAFRDAPRTRN